VALKIVCKVIRQQSALQDAAIDHKITFLEWKIDHRLERNFNSSVALDLDEEIGKPTKNVTLETARIEFLGKAEGSIRRETSDAGMFQNCTSHTWIVLPTEIGFADA